MTLRSGVLAPRRPSRVFASFRGLEELEHVSRGRQICLLGALLLALPAGAVTKTWQGANNGEWGTAGNWTPNGVPSNADDVVINVAQTIRLSAGIAAVAASVSIGAGATLNDRNSGSTLTVGGLISVTPNAGVTLDIRFTAGSLTQERVGQPDSHRR